MKRRWKTVRRRLIHTHRRHDDSVLKGHAFDFVFFKQFHNGHLLHQPHFFHFLKKTDSGQPNCVYLIPLHSSFAPPNCFQTPCSMSSLHYLSSGINTKIVYFCMFCFIQSSRKIVQDFWGPFWTLSITVLTARTELS